MFLSELTSESAAVRVFKNCQPWLTEAKNNTAFRNMQDADVHADVKWDRGNVLQLTARKNRAARDTPDWLHDAIGEWMKKKFDVNFRTDATFCAGESDQGKLIYSYGHPYFFYPIGKIDYIWSPDVADVYDIYFEEEARAGKYLKFCGGAWKQKITEIVIDRLAEATWRRNTDLAEALTHRGAPEVSVICDKYYLINTGWRQTGSFQEELRLLQKHK